MTTTIGTAAMIDGTVEGADDVTVRGRLTGRIDTSAAVLVDESAVVNADVCAASVVVRGTFDGAVQATDNARIAAVATASGSIRAARIILEDGARYTGTIEVGAGQR